MKLLQRMADLYNARPHTCAFILGILAALGFEPVRFWPLTLFAIASLIALIIRSTTWKNAAQIGWMFGLGHFMLGNNWIAAAFTYQAEMPAWLGWIAVGGLAMYLAIYPALATLGAWTVVNYARKRAQSSSPDASIRLIACTIFAFAACWIITEWMRSWVFTGFAWNPLGMIALGSFTRPGLAISAPWLGTYGLSGLVILLAGMWLIAAKRGKADGIAALFILMPIGLIILPVPISAPKQTGGLHYTLIQPNVRQALLNDPANYENQFIASARLSQRSNNNTNRLLLWPESGVPDYLRDGYPDYIYEGSTYLASPQLARDRLGKVIGPNTVLLTGTADLEMRNGDIIAARNVVSAITGKGAIIGSYAKAHLVPGGEYLPLRPLLEPLGATRLVPGSMDFWPGPGPATIDLGQWGKAGVQLCYEIIFSGQVVDRNHRPDYLFNPSNDGWFGTWGPPQHLAQARMRAIEEGLPVLRSTTNGISAVIDADGIVINSIPGNIAGHLDGSIPPAHSPGLFSQMGNLLPLCWAMLLLFLSMVAWRTKSS